MANLYLTEQGAVLRKSSDRLIVTKDKATLLEVPCHAIDAVLIFGNVQFTTAAVRELMEHNIEMALFTRRGKLLCQLTPPMGKNVPMRLAQYERARDPAFTLAFAKQVVTAKVRNGLTLVRQYAYNHPDADLQRALDELAGYTERIAAATTTDELFGVEGNAARIYFTAFSRMLRGAVKFPGRRKRPAPDPVNALLSFGYTLLFNEIASLLDGVGFDPHIGFFHRPDYGRASLAADLVEEFRAPVVDRLTLRLLNTRVFTPDDFYLQTNSGSMYLQRDSLRKYFTAYEELLGEPLTELGKGTEDTANSATAPAADAAAHAHFRSAFRRQVYRLQAVVIDGAAYAPFEL